MRTSRINAITIRANERGRARARRGVTLLEMITAFTLLVVGLLGYLQVIVVTSVAAQSSKEYSLAAEAARKVIEGMKAHTFKDIFALYNWTTADDPGGPGKGPGPNFAVRGLTAVIGDPDGMCGEILFPTFPGSPNVLREDLADPRFATPLDLNDDGAIDNGNHASDYQLLPVVVRVTWRGRAGVSIYELKTILVELP